jgi:large subunit ribosomal protein L25
MAMEHETLLVESRQPKGKGGARKLRKEGKLPGVIYGLGRNANVSLDPILIKKLLLEEGGRNRIFNLKGANLEGTHALLKDYQVDPVTRALVHVDLLEIDITKKIQVTVALNFSGKSVGVAEGGVLNLVERTVDIRCLPTAIPKHIDVDVTALRIGDSIHLDQVVFPEGIEKVVHTNSTLVTVVPPTKEEELAPSLAPTAEPEVITEKKPTEEEAAEGAETSGKAVKGEKEKEKDKDKEKKKT